MSINNASYWLLFFAMSRNQESYFSRLKQDMAVGGVVLNAKHPGWGGRFSALVWLLRRRHLWSQWLFFRVQKGRLNGQKAGKLFRFGLILRSTGCLAAVQSLCKSRAPDGIVLMNGAHYKQQIVLAYIREQGVQPLYMELGCLPDTTAIDGKGVNYNGAVPRDPCFYRGYHPSKDVDATLIKRPPRKPVGEPVDLPARYIFVPFQVYDDTQILLHSPWVDSMDLYTGPSNVVFLLSRKGGALSSRSILLPGSPTSIFMIITRGSCSQMQTIPKSLLKGRGLSSP